MLKIQDKSSVLLKGYRLFLIVDAQVQWLLFVSHADFESDNIVLLMGCLFVFLTAKAAWHKHFFKYEFPCRILVLRFLPALSLLPGQSPAQEAKCPNVGN